MKTCLMCGCSERRACTHTEYGPCGWIENEANVPLCTHCGHPDTVETANRIPANENFSAKINPYVLRMYFSTLGYKVTISKQVKIGVTCQPKNGTGWRIKLIFAETSEHAAIFDDLCEKIFPDHARTSPNSYLVDPYSNIFKKEVWV